MPSHDVSPPSEDLRLAVPELTRRPFVGGGCCVLAAADLICDGLGRLPGVHAVACDDVEGEVRLELEIGSGVGLLPTVRIILAGLGYPPTQERQ